MATKDEKAIILAYVSGKRVNSAGWIRANCPICPTRGEGPDKRQSFGFRQATGGFRCFRCGVNGRCQGSGFISPELADKVEDGEEKPKVTVPFDDFFPLWTEDGCNSNALEDHRWFLNNRGIHREHWEAAKIHGCISGRYYGRIIVPHIDADGEWWGFTSRTVPVNPNNPNSIILAALMQPEDNPKFVPPKVLYPKHMDRTKLYNEQALLVDTDDPVMLVEGCLDAAWYLPHAVAALGKPTPAHTVKLAATKRPLVICLDGDAWLDGRLLSQKLRLHGVRAGYVRLPPNSDPNSVSPDWLKKQVEQEANKLCKS